jgi:hypothetical protein
MQNAQRYPVARHGCATYRELYFAIAPGHFGAADPFYPYFNPAERSVIDVLYLKDYESSFCEAR